MRVTTADIWKGSRVVQVGWSLRRKVAVASRHSLILGAFRGPLDLGRYWEGSVPGRAFTVLSRLVEAVSRRVALMKPWLSGSSVLAVFNKLVLLPSTPGWKGSILVRSMDLAAGSPKGKAPWILPLALGAILFLIPFIPTLATAALVWLMALAVVAFRVGGKTFNVPRPLVVPGILFLIVLTLATVTSVQLSASVHAFVLWTSYLLLAIVAAVTLDDMEKVGFVLLCLLVSASMAGAYGLYQFSRGIETYSGWLDTEAAKEIQTRAYSVFDNPNIFATYLAFLIPVVAYIFLNTPRWGNRLVLLPVGLLIVGALAVTYSRGAWVGSALGLMFLGFLKDRKILLFILIAVVAAPILFPATVVDRVSTIGSLEDSSNMYRITIWRAAWLMAKDYWASGVGLGPAPFIAVYPLYEIAGTPTVHTHNLYLQILVEMGVPGLLVFLWLVLLVFREGLRPIPASPYHSGIAAALLAGLAGQIVYGLFDNIWYSPKNLFLFWTIVGVIMATRNRGGATARET